MDDHKINVTVSGSSIYKAVANYLKNSCSLQEQIQAKVEQILDEDTMNELILKEFHKYNSKRDLKEFIDAEIRKEIKKELQKELPKQVKEALKQYMNADKIFESIIGGVKDAFKGKENK